MKSCEPMPPTLGWTCVAEIDQDRERTEVPHDLNEGDTFVSFLSNVGETIKETNPGFLQLAHHDIKVEKCLLFFH